MTTDPLTTGGAYLIAGGFVGFAMGYAIKKMIKLAIIVIGLFFSILVYLQYRGWITIQWPKIQSDVSNTGHQLANQTIAAVNQTAHQMAHSSMNSPDVLFPYIGMAGFVPGLILGLMRG